MSTESNKIPAVEKSNPYTVPVKCLNENCKFYGDSNKMNYCSMCYKEYLKTHNEDDSKASVDNKSSESETKCDNKIKRCGKCNKKVGFLGFKCKCGNVYCNEHRDFDKHDCMYDYKNESKMILNKNNPKVVNPKIESI